MYVYMLLYIVILYTYMHNTYIHKYNREQKVEHNIWQKAHEKAKNPITPIMTGDMESCTKCLPSRHIPPLPLNPTSSPCAEFLTPAKLFIRLKLAASTFLV